MIPRVVSTSSVALRMLSFSTAGKNKRKTFLFRSRLPQTDVQSPYADPMRTRVEVQDDVFITVKDPEEDIALNSSVGSFLKSAVFTEKLPSFGVNNKVILSHYFV
uniref:Kinesin motor domain-containing protein n=1 Tax=Elaeophora elaphi TaxID=1147741 RepID=A0A0R3RHU1_9BILA